MEKYGYSMMVDGSDYNINGDKDYQTNYKLAQQYFNGVNAPYKEMFIMENTTHGLLESKSEEFSKIVHQIAENERTRYEIHKEGKK